MAALSPESLRLNFFVLSFVGTGQCRPKFACSIPLILVLNLYLIVYQLAETLDLSLIRPGSLCFDLYPTDTHNLSCVFGIFYARFVYSASAVPLSFPCSYE